MAASEDTARRIAPTLLALAAGGWRVPRDETAAWDAAGRELSALASECERLRAAGAAMAGALEYAGEVAERNLARAVRAEQSADDARNVLRDLADHARGRCPPELWARICGVLTWACVLPAAEARPRCRTAWRCHCGAWNYAACRTCGKGPDERFASGAELDALATQGGDDG